jgi:hypothetical protein
VFAVFVPGAANTVIVYARVPDTTIRMTIFRVTDPPGASAASRDTSVTAWPSS